MVSTGSSSVTSGPTKGSGTSGAQERSRKYSSSKSSNNNSSHHQGKRFLVATGTGGGKGAGSATGNGSALTGVATGARGCRRPRGSSLGAPKGSVKPQKVSTGLPFTR